MSKNFIQEQPKCDSPWSLSLLNMSVREEYKNLKKKKTLGRIGRVHVTKGITNGEIND